MQWMLAGQCPEFWVNWISRVSIYGGLAVLGTWVICRFLHPLSPTVRSWLWRLVYVKFAVLILWPGPIRVPLFPTPGISIQRDSASASRSESSNRPIVTTHANNLSPGQDLLGRCAVLPSAALLAVWLTGVVIILVRTARGVAVTRSLVRQSQPIRDPQLGEQCAFLSASRGVKRVPRLLSHAVVPSPQTAGLVDPVILFPAWFPSDYSIQEIRMVLTHELAHIQRHDLLWAWVRRLVNALLFFHPLIWLAHSQATLSEEMACDDAAVRSGNSCLSEYASTLLKIAERGLGATAAPKVLQGLGMSRSYRLMAVRLKALEEARNLCPGLSRWKWRLATFPLWLGAAGLLVLGVVSLFHDSGTRQIDPRYPVLGFKVSRGHTHTLSTKRELHCFAGLTFSRNIEPPITAQPWTESGAGTSVSASYSITSKAPPGAVGVSTRVAGWLQVLGLKPKLDTLTYQTTMRTSAESCALMVRFALSPQQNGLPEMEAFLEDKQGESIPLVLERNEFPPETGECLKCWIIDPAPITRAQFRLRLKLAGAGTDVALLRLGEL